MSVKRIYTITVTQIDATEGSDDATDITALADALLPGLVKATGGSAVVTGITLVENKLRMIEQEVFMAQSTIVGE